MARVQRRKVIQALIDGLQLDVGLEKVPVESGQIIVPTYNLNHRHDFQKDEIINYVAAKSTESNNTNVTVYTTPSTGKFYLTNLMFGAFDTGSNQAYVTAYVNGVLIYLVYIFSKPNIAHTIVENYPFPILLDAGSIINVKGNAAACKAHCNIKGFTTN